MKILLLAAAAWGALAARAPYGVLLLAHGGDESWNREVAALRDSLAAGLPIEAAFGMADPNAIESALRRLEAASPLKIVAVPLFVNSSSEVLDQTRYVLGLAQKPSETMTRAARAHPGHAMPPSRRVASKLPLVMTSALDDHPLVAEVLSQRAKALSQTPVRETVILVGHGPVDDRAVKDWKRVLRSLGEGVRRSGGFRDVRGALLRDDAEPRVRERAVRELRELVRRSAAGGRAIVVPVLVARGGIEGKVASALEGLPYAWDGRTLLPHPNIEAWVRDTAAWGARREDMRRFAGGAWLRTWRSADSDANACGDEAPACGDAGRP